MKNAVSIAVLCFGLGYAAPAVAQNELGVRVSSQFVGSSGLGGPAGGGLFAVGSSSNLWQGEFSYSRRVAQPRFGALWAEVAWTVGNRSESSLYGAFTTSLLAQDYTVGVRYTLPVTTWFVPHLRAGVGALVGQFGLNDGAGGSVVSTSAWSVAATGYLLGGVELLIPRSAREGGKSPTTAGLVIEAGYSLASPLSFHLQPEHVGSGDTLTIPITGADLGSFALSGPVLRIGAVLRF